MNDAQRRCQVTLIVLLILLGLLASIWLAGRYAEQRAWQDRSVEARGQLQLYAQSIHTLVERFRSVPEVLLRLTETPPEPISPRPPK